jgi:hypothetical protein
MFFSLPAALLAGSLDELNNSSQRIFNLPKWSLNFLSIGLGAILIIAFLDYIQIENRFTDLRFRISKVGDDYQNVIPKTIALSHLRDYIKMARTEPTPGMSVEQLKKWDELATFRPSAFAVRRMMVAYSLNGHPERAQYWADRLCLFVERRACELTLHDWRAGDFKPIITENWRKPASSPQGSRDQ